MLLSSRFLLLAAAALAGSDRCPDPQDPPPAPRVFHATADGLVPASATPMWFGFVDGGERFTIEIQGVRATVHGAAGELPASRIRRAGASVQVLDAAGLVVAQVRPTPTGGVLETFPDRARPSLGVRLLPAPPERAQAAGHPASSVRLVAAVLPGGGAEAAGVRAGDLLFEVAGGGVDEPRLRDVLSARRAGDTVTAKVWREGVEVAAAIVLRPVIAPSTAPAGPRPAVEFRDGVLFVLDRPERGELMVAQELQALRERMQRLETMLQEALAKAEKR